MKIFKYLKGVLDGMAKVRPISPKRDANSLIIIGKRKLDYNYTGFISSTTRPPLSSPKLEENSGVNKDAKIEK